MAGYTVTIGGTAVTALAGSLSFDQSVGRRSQASFTAHTTTSTHFQQYQQVNITDGSGTLAFSGYITSPAEVKPGFQDSLLHSITCVDQHFLADKRLIASSYTNRTCGEIALSILNNYLAAEGVTLGMIYDGIQPATTLYPDVTLYPGGNVGLIPNATFVYATIAAALDALVTAASTSGVPYYWMIDLNKQLWFVPYTAVVNATTVDGTLLEQHANPPKVTRANPTYRNIQYIIGGVAQTVSQDETRKGDGTATAFTMGFDLATVPTVKVNGTTKTIGIKGLSTGKDWYWQKGSPVVTQDTAGTKLTTSDTLEVIYIGQYPTVSVATNNAQISYEAAIDGTSGQVEHVVNDATITSTSDGLSEAGQLLTRYATQNTQIVFVTRSTGFIPGQLLTVNLPAHGLYNAQMLVENVNASDQADGYNIWYTVTAIAGPYDTTWQSFWGKALATPPSPDSINIGVTQSILLLANFTATITPTGTFSAAPYACPLPGSTQFPATTLLPC